MESHNPDTSIPIETIQLDPIDRKRIAHTMNAVSQRHVVPFDRRDARHDYLADGCEVRLVDAMGREQSYAVTPRNLAVGGFAFIHGQHIDINTPCIVTLVTLDGQTEQVRGSIRRSRKVRGVIHEIAVGFDTCINLAPFVHIEPGQTDQAMTRAIARQHMVIHVADASHVDSAWARCLRSTAADVRHVDDLSQVTKEKMRGVNLLVIEIGQEPEQAALLATMDRLAVTCPVLILRTIETCADDAQQRPLHSIAWLSRDPSVTDRFLKTLMHLAA